MAAIRISAASSRLDFSGITITSSLVGVRERSEFHGNAKHTDTP